MNTSSPKDRRTYPRHPLVTGVQFSHGPSQRQFPGRCIDISKGGMLMFAPVATPVQPGDYVKVTLGSVGRPEFASLGERPIEASVVRVDRKALLSKGHIVVGMRFMQA